MTATTEIIEFLREIGQTTDATTGEPARNIVRISRDDQAVEGSISWISAKNAAASPSRLESFRGTLLIAPLDAPRHGGMVRCRNPKLAFIRVTQEFFSSLAETVWRISGGGDFVEATIGPGVVFGGAVAIGAGSVIGPNTILANCAIGKNVVIGANCSIGLPGFGYEKDDEGRWWRFPHTGDVIIEDDVEIGSNTCVDRGTIGATRIRRGAKIDNLVHVAHNVDIGESAMIIANAMLGGSAVIADSAWVAPSSSVMNQITIGAGATLGMGAVVLKTVNPGAVVVGNPGRVIERKA